ncbi:hypothetical protein THAOC_04136 [Thalassiosira oceanica]|uniref:Uncharacterized protein n=1 Tax=Thalassiosira oceanica TaxID=159749 RepID=K0TJX9_THAOC|nr:hypothetical protein THAOC_04136 [Thalassiosira oceanica]|eukprot:EJK74201.1 hypothetical protein THAOC_04136 [Thalassiosira oceanica]
MDRPPSTSTLPTSIFEAIKNDDWQGLLALYATNALDAVRSYSALRSDAERPRGSTGQSIPRQQPPPTSSLISGENIQNAAQLPILGILHSKERVTTMSSRESCALPDNPLVRELDEIAQQILGQIGDPTGVAVGEKKREGISSSSMASALDHILHHSTLPQSSREFNWGKIISQSVSELSNSRPLHTFTVRKNARRRREDMKGTETGELPDERDPLIFEGHLANSTPGDVVSDGGTGTGTAQHLACLLDSPFALMVLLVFGVDVESRHTAFRRLAIHEAAQADSPRCLSLLLELGTRFTDGKCDASCGESFTDDKSEQSRKKCHLKKKKRKNFFSLLEKKRSPDGEGVDSTNIPHSLKTMWKAVQHMQCGDMNEMDAAHFCLDRLTIPTKSGASLTLQCPQNTPLHWASFKNSIRAIDVLLSFNADVNSRAQPSGWTPLHDAAYSDASDAAARLISAGSFVDAKSHSGATPLCFAAQENAPNATRLLLQSGADPSVRCTGNTQARANNADNSHPSRFSGYTPLHYCAHYNAADAAQVLLYERGSNSSLSTVDLLEIVDVTRRMPIHVAVARGSCEVLQEILHAGARVETSFYHPSTPLRIPSMFASPPSPDATSLAIPILGAPHNIEEQAAAISTISSSPTSVVHHPVSPPILKAMLPSQPVTSSKPWNCLSQQSINGTTYSRQLTGPRFLKYFDVGKRLEQQGRGIYLDLWPNILAFVGRGWFEIDDVPSRKLKLPALVINMDAVNEEEHMEDDDMQFELEEHIAIL